MCIEPLTGIFVQLGCEVFVRNKVSMIFLPTGNDLSPEARILVDLEHVDACVRDSSVDQRAQRVVPALACLMRQSRDEIHVDVGNARSAQARNVGYDRLVLVQASYRRRFFIHERLHAQTHTVHPAALQYLQDGIGQSARSTLDRNF
jgi:hypothetical protein